MRFSPAIVALLLVLAACERPPQPFASTGSPVSRELLELSDRNGIVIMPVEGLLPDDARRLETALAAALQANNIPATFGSGNSHSYFLLGERVAGQGGSGRMMWNLLAADGGEIGTYAQIIPSPSLFGGNKSIARRLAEEAAPALAAMIQRDMPAEYTAPSLYIGPVTGAPSDGNRRLQTLLRALLQRAGYTLVPVPTGDGITVLGEVRVNPAAGQRETVAIDWVLTDARGGHIGTISQARDMPAGSLAEGWGPAATEAATAAATAISQAIDRIDRSRLPEARKTGEK